MRIVFVEEWYNKQSVAVLVGALEAAGVEFPGGFVISKKGRLPEPVTGPDGTAAAEILAFSFQTASLPEVAGRLGRLKRRYARLGIPAIFIAGGPHVSGDPAGTLELGFDMVLAGEGEESFPALVEALAEGKDLSGIPGLAFRRDGAIAVNPPAAFIDLDDFPPFGADCGKYGTIEISRGCPWRCAYCQTPVLAGGRMRHRSLENVLLYARRGYELGMKDIRFTTSNALAWGSADGRTPDCAKIETLLRACGDIFGKDHVFFGSFPSEVRPESVTEETAALLRELAANDNIVLGAQSGSDAHLKRIKRGHGIETVYRAVEILVGRGFKTIVDFILGLPFETDEDRELTRKAMLEVVRLGALVHSHFFMPLPSTPLWKEKSSPVDAETRSLLGRLGREGKQFGRWGAQERCAARISDFLEQRDRNRAEKGVGYVD